VWQWCFTVKRILVGPTLLYHLLQTTTYVVEFEVRARDRASVLLISSVVFGVDSFVIGKVNIIALRVCVDRQVVTLARIRKVPVAFSRSSAILVVGHFVTV
jgi:hypothetical protein